METNKKLKAPGFVYVVESTDGSVVKIGKTTKPNQRIKTLQSKPKAKGRVYVSVLQPDHSSIERECHRHFHSKRIFGEWFCLRFDEAVSYLESILEAEISEDEAEKQKQEKRKQEKQCVDRFLEYFFPDKSQKIVENFQSNLAIAEVMRNTILVSGVFCCESLIRNQNLYGLSEFEFLMCNEIESIDKYCIAQLMHEVVECSKDKHKYDKFLNEIRSSLISNAEHKNPANAWDEVYGIKLERLF